MPQPMLYFLFVVRGLSEKACFQGVFASFRIVVEPLIFSDLGKSFNTTTYVNLKPLLKPQLPTTIRAILADPVDT